MRLRSIVLAVAMAAAGSLPALTAPAAVAPCQRDVVVGDDIFGVDTPPTLRSKDEDVRISLYGVDLTDCPGTSVTLRNPSGGALTLPLDQYLPDVPPDRQQRIARLLTVPLATGAGTWQITAIKSGTSVRALHHPFTVQRAGEITLNPPNPVFAPTRVTVSGRVEHATSTGDPAPSAGTAVTIRSAEPDDTGYVDRAYLTTRPDGTFTGSVAIPPGSTSIYAVPRDGTYVYGTSDSVAAAVFQPSPQPAVQVVRLLRSATAYVNQWWRLDGTVYPGTLWHHLQLQNTSGWQSTGSFGYSAPGGSFTRWWKPTRTGTFTLRIKLGQSGVRPNAPQYRQFTVTVKSKQTVPAYLDGVVAPTSGGTVYRGTTMSSYGHLKDRYSNGTVGPFAGQKVAIQLRDNPATSWHTVATTAPTTSTGYFSVHWLMPAHWNPLDAPLQRQVRFVYYSPYVTIRNAVLDKGSITVYP